MTARRMWTCKRLAISGFVLVHLSAVFVFNMPMCAIRAKVLDLSVRYLYPLGLWQNWSMFAPNPINSTVTVEALAVDKNGMMHNFVFPKMADYSIVEGVTRVRHSKFTTYLASDEFNVLREIAARHVVRQLDIAPEAFPVEVELRYVVRDTPPPGTVPDPMAPTRISPIKEYRFPNWQEARP